MKKLHSLAFFALVTPAITLGSAALFAAEEGSERDIGEQSMGHDALPKNQDSERHQESTESKYNEPAPSDHEVHEDGSERDVGEQSMGHDASPKHQDTERHQEAKKSKYNEPESTDPKADDQ
ncbi:hypothetical protein [Marinobacter salicampi]|uniref:hypothetical protein n=1 Tax=Marinobacter salicampi TaxID=435907 RepID=UPI00140820DF|nr:hypothetical protein [Marinobacter salicampi]